MPENPTLTTPAVAPTPANSPSATPAESGIVIPNPTTTPSSTTAGESTEEAIIRRMRDLDLLTDSAPSTKQAEPPAPPAEVKTPQSADLEEDSLKSEISSATEKMTRDQREAFTKKTYELRDYKRKVKELEATASKTVELEAQLKAAQEAAAKAPTAPPDYEQVKLEAETLRKRFSEADQELAATRLEKSEVFRKEIGEPLAVVEAEMGTIVKRYGMDPAQVAKVVASNTEDRTKLISEVASEMAEYDRQKFFRQVDAFDALADKKTALMSNAQAALSQLTARQQEQTQAEQSRNADEYKAAVPKFWNELAAAAELKPVDGNDAWNAALSDAQSFPTKYTYEAFDTPSQAGIMARAAAHPLLVGALQTAKTQLAEANALITRMRGATPAAGGGAATAVQPTSATARLPFEEAITVRMREAGLL